MDLLATVALWGGLAGLAAGLALSFLASADARFAAEALCTRFGTGGTLLMLVWWLVAEHRADPNVELALGVAAVGSLVAGTVLSIVRHARSRG